MGRYVLSRLAQFVGVLFGALCLVFVVMYLIADPAATMLPASAPPEVIAAFNAEHGFDRPFLVQFLDFLQGAVRLDFGQSIWLGGSALSQALARIPATLLLSLTAVGLGSIVGVLLAVYAVRRPTSVVSRALGVVALASVSVAEFWLGLMAILLFAVVLPVFPTGGVAPMPAALVLPVLVLGLRPMGRVFQMTRSAMGAEYGKQYVLTARAKGVKETVVARQHVLRNAALPVVTLALFELARVFVGAAIVIEVVFAWPGLGRLAVGALQHGDVYLVQAVVVVAAFATGLLNLVADLLYFALDPRTRSLVRKA